MIRRTKWAAGRGKPRAVAAHPAVSRSSSCCNSRMAAAVVRGRVLIDWFTEQFGCRRAARLGTLADAFVRGLERTTRCVTYECDVLGRCNLDHR